MIDSFDIRPHSYKERVNAIFEVAGSAAVDARTQLKQLIDEAKGILL
jgi:hypothetical protein